MGLLSAARESLPNENNKLKPEDRAPHDWYRFVLSFPPHLVRRYLRRFNADSHSRVLDPFCGTGTTLAECKKLGIPSVGLEPNPMAHFAAQVKGDWCVDPHAMLRHAEDVSRSALEKLEEQGITDREELPLFHRRRKSMGTLRTLSPERQKLLLKDSMSPLPLHKTLMLLESLEEHGDTRFDRHERLALAKALVSRISNLHFGPEVGVRQPKFLVPVMPTWMDSVRAMANDLCWLKDKAVSDSVVYQADSRYVAKVLPANSVDLVITSPPYPNEKDYTRTTRLESVLLGFIRNKDDLRLLKRCLVRSNTRGVYKADSDDSLVADNKEIQEIADAIEARRVQLGKTSGFERLYARVTKLYFGGMVKHFSALRTVLRPGAQLAYVVGDQASYLRVMIRTGRILAGIARSLGYEVLGIDLFRTRLATSTRAHLREEVLLLRWPRN